MPVLPLTVVDVFTLRPLAGNALAVVHDADELTEEVMGAFARETRLSETTFVQRASAAGADYRNRIWTVLEEVPFAGHPSLGTAAAVAWRRGETAASYTQQTGAGLQEVQVKLHSETRGEASVVQEKPCFENELDPDPLLEAVGLARADAHPEWPAQVVSTGLPATLIPLASEGALTRARPDWSRLRHFSCNTYFFWLDPASGRATARCFPPAQAEAEDPATGSAAGALMAYVWARVGLDRLRIAQGRELGRPSLIDAVVEDGGRPRVSGGVVLLVTGEVRLPRE